MIEITITTKAGKFVMKGEEFVNGFLGHMNSHTESGRESKEWATSWLEAFLSTYEEEVKTEDEPCVCDLYHLGRPQDCNCKQHGCNDEKTLKGLSV